MMQLLEWYRNFKDNGDIGDMGCLPVHSYGEETKFIQAVGEALVISSYVKDTVLMVKTSGKFAYVVNGELFSNLHFAWRFLDECLKA